MYTSEGLILPEAALPTKHLHVSQAAESGVVQVYRCT
jgi:hypothetical protein